MRTMNALPKLSLIGTVVAASLLLAGCGEDSKAAGPVILKTAFNQSEHNPQFKALEDFSQKLEAATGGKYKLVADKAETASSFAFTEDNITGAWTIWMGSRRTRFNRVKAKFFNRKTLRSFRSSQVRGRSANRS